MKENEYRCKYCGEIWEFCPEDYEYEKEIYPASCPFCEMPIWQMIKDVYAYDGLKAVLRHLLVRVAKLLI